MRIRDRLSTEQAESHSENPEEFARMGKIHYVEASHSWPVTERIAFHIVE
jgi:hypothetical protein